MKYRGRSDFKHGERGKLGVLILNLGTPDAPTTPALRKYLGQFLADPRVVEVPRLLWRVILHGIILRIRPRRSAAAYRTVWTQEGSPLLVHTQNQAKLLQEALKEEYGDDIVVEFAMRYGNPSVDSAIEKLMNAGVRKLLALPLYPQYSGSTSASTFDAIAQDFMKRRWLPDFRFVSHYHDHPQYIEAIANTVRKHREEHGSADKLIFSYHGVPKKYLLKGDPYHCECYKTTRLVAEHLGLDESEYMTTFQSRFGREEWLQPYTDVTMKALPKQGVKNIQVICPGFSSDCLETVEEIDEENREYFMDSGGESFSYIPCLNSQPSHIQLLKSLVEENIQGWQAQSDESAQQSKQNATKVMDTVS
ncbi:MULTISPECIES: ferrochelatase [Gammaproteobacteria]|uniref:ferrochelatase n=1 Tax=Gammaproteobacteria TaxID=1236 RepID=UPI000DCFCDFE|nr:MULTISPECIES: ferrochelatase [Gammaproteobacteria]RTE85573.1 ferrochelatase [Aliidiomarina sp. B3213]TCZ89543.1 ferrochelatase [Lysobacter sp. N42]